MHTFNLFRRKEEADLYCAVPVDRPVPELLTEDKWEYACSLNVESLSGFDAAAARASADANGFYLFHSEA
jgi:hypothetical protein